MPDTRAPRWLLATDQGVACKIILGLLNPKLYAPFIIKAGELRGMGMTYEESMDFLIHVIPFAELMELIERISFRNKCKIIRRLARADVAEELPLRWYIMFNYTTEEEKQRVYQAMELDRMGISAGVFKSFFHTLHSPGACIIGDVIRPPCTALLPGLLESGQLRGANKSLRKAIRQYSRGTRSGRVRNTPAPTGSTSSSHEASAPNPTTSAADVVESESLAEARESSVEADTTQPIEPKREPSQAQVTADSGCSSGTGTGLLSAAAEHDGDKTDLADRHDPRAEPEPFIPAADPTTNLTTETTRSSDQCVGHTGSGQTIPKARRKRKAGPSLNAVEEEEASTEPLPVASRDERQTRSNTRQSLARASKTRRSMKEESSGDDEQDAAASSTVNESAFEKSHSDDSDLSSLSPAASDPSATPPPSSTTKRKRKPTNLTSPYFNKTKDAPTKSPRKRPTNPKTAAKACPPLTAPRFGVIQELLWQNPWHLLVACIFLNLTSGRQAIPIFRQVIEKWPTPALLAEADYEILRSMICSLGLEKRAAMLIRLAQQWTSGPPEKGIMHRRLHYPLSGDGSNTKAKTRDDTDAVCGYLEIVGYMGLGRYAFDAWRIFCRDVFRGVAEGYDGEGAPAADFEPEWKRVLPQDKELRAFLQWMWLREGWVWNPYTGEKHEADEELMQRAREGQTEWPHYDPPGEGEKEVVLEDSAKDETALVAPEDGEGLASKEERDVSETQVGNGSTSKSRRGKAIQSYDASETPAESLHDSAGEELRQAPKRAKTRDMPNVRTRSRAAQTSQ